MTKRNRCIAGMCAIALSAAFGCSSRKPIATQSQPIAPFAVPTSPPRPKADEPIELFVARWNAWVDSVPEDQRVGDAIERAKDRMNEKLRQMSNVDEGYDAFDMMGLAEPGGKFWEEAGRIYESIAPELDLMRELVQRDAVAIHIDPNLDEGEDANYLFGSYSWSVRDAASVLRYRVRYLTLAGRTQESVGDVRAIFDTERLMLELPGLLGWFGANSSREKAWNILRTALAIDPDAFTDEQLAEFQSRLLGWIDEDMTPIIQAEEYFALIHLRDLYKDAPDGELSEETTETIIEIYTPIANMLQILDLPPVFGLGKGKGRKRSAIEFAPLDQQIAMLKEYNAALIEDFHAYPPTQRSSHLNRLADELSTSSDAVEFIPAFMYAGVNEILGSIELLDSIETRAAVVVLAIHRHRLRTGDWPRSLEEIDPAILRVDPEDLHTGELFGYAIIDGSPLLWSGGPDRDNDGGFAFNPILHPEGVSPNLNRSWFTLDEWDAMSEEDQAKYDGDWILFPPEVSDRWGNEQQD